MPDRQDINTAPITGEIASKPVALTTRSEFEYVALRLRVNGRRWDADTEDWVTKTVIIPFTVWRKDLRDFCLDTLKPGAIVALQYRLGAYTVNGRYGEDEILTTSVEQVVVLVQEQKPPRRRAARRAVAKDDAQTQFRGPAATADDDIPF